MSSDTAIPQNIYDDPTFFAGYKALRHADSGLNGAIEVPALRQLLPSLAGRHVFDLGCGFGHFARYAREAGAATVTALDISQKMLEEASRLTNDPAISYVHGSIESYAFEPGSFDVIVSSMALHYVADYAAAVHRVFEALKPGGRFVFSVEHPVCTANPIGWIKDEDGKMLHWPLDHYLHEGQRNTNWFVDGVVKYHRTVATYINVLIAAGFKLDHLGEPGPTAEAMASRPALASEKRRPPILVLAVTRP